MIENVQVVRDMYDAFGRKDEARLRQLLHPDIEWIQCVGFPGGGHRHGVDEVLEKVFRSLRAEWNDWRTEIEEYLRAGQTVVVLGRYAGTHAATNRSMTAVFAHVYDVEDGRITRFRQYTDTAELVRAAQPGLAFSNRASTPRTRERTDRCQTQHDSPTGKIVETERLGGLLRSYHRAA